MSLPPYTVLFNREGKIFTSYNYKSDQYAALTPSIPLPLLDDYSPRYLRRLNFQHKNYPYLPFIPANPDFSSPIMGHFANLSVKDDSSGWSLDRK